jgi:prolipoprotein diacylglyceryltransferase
MSLLLLLLLHHPLEVNAQRLEQCYIKQHVLLTTYIEQLLMVIVVPIMILFLVEHRHQVSQHALLIVVLTVLMGLVRFSLELVDLNIEQEHAPGQTVLHIHKHSLQFVVQHFVVLGVVGLLLLQEYKKEAEPVKTQTAQLAQRQKLDVLQEVRPPVDLVVELGHLEELVPPQP